MIIITSERESDYDYYIERKRMRIFRVQANAIKNNKNIPK